MAGSFVVLCFSRDNERRARLASLSMHADKVGDLTYSGVVGKTLIYSFDLLHFFTEGLLPTEESPTMHADKVEDLT